VYIFKGIGESRHRKRKDKEIALTDSIRIRKSAGYELNGGYSARNLRIASNEYDIRQPITMLDFFKH
jgi:hypothetical protein